VQVIHFTEGATDPLQISQARGARFVRRADGSGDTRIASVHLAPGGQIPELPITQSCVLRIVHGDVVLKSASYRRLDLSAGVGLVMSAGEECSPESLAGAILVLMQGPGLEAHEGGISTPTRIMGQRWPGEAGSGAPGLP